MQKVCSVALFKLLRWAWASGNHGSRRWFQITTSHRVQQVGSSVVPVQPDVGPRLLMNVRPPSPTDRCRAGGNGGNVCVAAGQHAVDRWHPGCPARSGGLGCRWVRRERLGRLAAAARRRSRSREPARTDSIVSRLVRRGAVSGDLVRVLGSWAPTCGRRSQWRVAVLGDGPTASVRRPLAMSWGIGRAGSAWWRHAHSARELSLIHI